MKPLTQIIQRAGFVHQIGKHPLFIQRMDVQQIAQFVWLCYPPKQLLHQTRRSQIIRACEDPAIYQKGS